MPSKVRLPLVLALALGVAALAGCGGDPAPRPPKNLLILALDTLRADHLGCYGYPLRTSPNLDALARESYVFLGAQSAAPWTAPSLMTLATSLHPEAHGVLDFPAPNRLPEEVVTLAEALQARGLRTAAFTEGGYAKGSFGLDQGVEHYPSFEGDDLGHSTNTTDDSRLEENLERLLTWIDERGEEPFFALFQTYEPHFPLRAPEEYVRQFLPGYDLEAEHEEVARILARWGAGEDVDAQGMALLQRHLRHCGLAPFQPVPREEELGARFKEFAAGGPDEQTIDYMRAQYDAEILYLDDKLGELFAALEERGRMEDTIILIVSDHGEGLGDHGLLGHGRVLYTELLNIVYVLRVPGHESRGEVLDYPARMIDAMPTLLELLDVDPGGAVMQGTSLVPVISGESTAAGTSFAHATKGGNRLRGARAFPWHLIVDDDTGAAELYDLRVDPGELVNVASQHPDVVARLRAELEHQQRLDAALRASLGGDVPDTELDAELLRELEHLGYVGDNRDDE